eukprot:Em0695g6a
MVGSVLPLLAIASLVGIAYGQCNSTAPTTFCSGVACNTTDTAGGVYGPVLLRTAGRSMLYFDTKRVSEGRGHRCASGCRVCFAVCVFRHRTVLLLFLLLLSQYERAPIYMCIRCTKWIYSHFEYPFVRFFECGRPIHIRHFAESSVA